MLFIALFNYLTPNRVHSDVLLLCVLNTDNLNPAFNHSAFTSRIIRLPQYVLPGN